MLENNSSIFKSISTYTVYNNTVQLIFLNTAYTTGCIIRIALTSNYCIANISGVIPCTAPSLSPSGTEGCRSAPTLPSLGQCSPTTAPAPGIWNCLPPLWWYLLNNFLLLTIRYILVGRPKLMCTEDGSWNGETPSCRSRDRQEGKQARGKWNLSKNTSKYTTH